MSAAVWSIGVSPPRLTPLARLRYGDVIVWTDAEGREQVRTVYGDPEISYLLCFPMVCVPIGHHGVEDWLVSHYDGEPAQ